MMTVLLVYVFVVLMKTIFSDVFWVGYEVGFRDCKVMAIAQFDASELLRLSVAKMNET